MATFSDRLLVYLTDPNQLTSFLNGMNLGGFFTSAFGTRYNTEFWQVAQVAVGARRNVAFQLPTWIETRLIGREEHQTSPTSKTYIDYRVFGQETALWSDARVDLETTWLVNQFPGSVAVSAGSPPGFGGLGALISVLRLDAGNHPLDPNGAALAATLDAQGRVMTDPPNPVPLRLDPLAGALIRPDGSIFSLVRLELFPTLGSAAPMFGAPLGSDGQPLINLRMDHQGNFTTLAGAPSARDPLTGLPLDGNGNPARPARLTIPGGGTIDYRFFFSLPVDTARQTFQFVARLYLFARPEFNLVEDLRMALTLSHWLNGSQDTLLSLSDPANRQPYALALVYEGNALGGTRLSLPNVRRLGEAVGVLIHFFSIP